MALRELAKIQARITKLEAGKHFSDGRPRMFVESNTDAYNILRIKATDEVEKALAEEGITRPLDASITILVLIGWEGMEQL